MRFPPSIQLFDAHNHLQLPHPTCAPAELVQRALRAGVHAAAVCGTGPADWPRLAALKSENPCFVFAQYGVHPWWLTDEIARSEAWATELRAILAADASAGIGETGLDKTRRSRATLAVQKEVCLEHLRIARDLRRPVTLHCVRAYGSLLELLETFRADECGGDESGGSAMPTCVLHGFRGPPDLVPRFARMGCYFSFGGSPLDAAHLQLITAVPKHRLLFETDSPDQCPDARVLGAEARAPTANEPAHLAAIIRYIAEESGWDPCELALLVSANARTVFAFDKA